MEEEEMQEGGCVVAFSPQPRPQASSTTYRGLYLQLQ